MGAARRSGDVGARGRVERISVTDNVIGVPQVALPAGAVGTPFPAGSWNMTVPGLVQLFATMSTAASDADHPAHEFFVARYERLRDEFTKDIERRIGEGELAESVDPARLASIMIAVADGLQVQWLLDPELDMPDHIEYLWALFHEVSGSARG